MFEGYININGQELPLESSFKSFKDFINSSGFHNKRLQEYCKQKLTKEAIEKLNYNQLNLLKRGLKYIDNVYNDCEKTFDGFLSSNSYYTVILGSVKLNISDELHIGLIIYVASKCRLEDTDCLERIMNLRYNDYFKNEDYVKKRIENISNKLIYELSYDE